MTLQRFLIILHNLLFRKAYIFHQLRYLYLQQFCSGFNPPNKIFFRSECSYIVQYMQKRL